MVSKGRKKDKSIVVRVSENEKNQFEFLAKKFGLSISEFIISSMYYITQCNIEELTITEIDEVMSPFDLEAEYLLYSNEWYSAYCNRLKEFVESKK